MAVFEKQKKSYKTPENVLYLLFRINEKKYNNITYTINSIIRVYSYSAFSFKEEIKYYCPVTSDCNFRSFSEELGNSIFSRKCNVNLFHFAYA